jgi:hypothetical protein
MEEEIKIIVLNGSPKGKLSVTMQYINYIEKIFPHHELKIFDISRNGKIKFIRIEESLSKDK